MRPSEARGHQSGDGEPATSSGERAAPDIKDRLLDAAFAIFAEQGFEGTSIRAVTQAAGASVSAANYHFGSKQELLTETLRRRVAPVNERRLERLSGLEARHPDGVPIEEIVDAFLRPLFQARAEARAESVGERALFRQVAGRVFADPVVRSLRAELFAGVNDRYRAALERSLPDVPAERLRLFMQLMISTMMGWVLQQESDSEMDPEVVLSLICGWIVGGIRGAAATSHAGGRS